MATLKALVCDDEAPLRDLMARRLEKLGLEVERAEDGKDAIAHLERNHYDLLVTDIYMPDVTGLELLQRMKALDPHAQVVVVTASATLDNAVKALNDGAFAYLTKPFDHLSVFDNVVSRAIDFRRAILDNLRMAEVQRMRGDMLEKEVAGRIRQLKRTQEYMATLLACLPVGVAVIDESHRAVLLNPRGETYLEETLAGGDASMRQLLESVPAVEGHRHGEVEVGGRRLELSLSDLALPGDQHQQVLMLREQESSAPAMGSLVQEALLNLRRGLMFMARREQDPSSRKIIKGMAVEVSSLANLLDVELLPEVGAASPPEGPEEGATRILPPSTPDDELALASAVLPTEPVEMMAAPGNGRDLVPYPSTPEPVPESVEAQLPNTGSLLLRKGMSMVLEGRIKRKKPSAEPAPSPEDAERMQQKIERWARSGASAGEASEDDLESADEPAAPSVWPPPLPSSNGKN